MRNIEEYCGLFWNIEECWGIPNFQLFIVIWGILMNIEEYWWILRNILPQISYCDLRNFNYWRRKAKSAKKNWKFGIISAKKSYESEYLFSLCGAQKAPCIWTSRAFVSLLGFLYTLNLIGQSCGTNQIPGLVFILNITWYGFPFVNKVS